MKAKDTKGSYPKGTKRERNRSSAQLCRLRRKERFEKLAVTLVNMRKAESELQGRMAEVSAQNQELRAELQYLKLVQKNQDVLAYMLEGLQGRLGVVRGMLSGDPRPSSSRSACDAGDNVTIPCRSGRDVGICVTMNNSSLTECLCHRCGLA